MSGGCAIIPDISLNEPSFEADQDCGMKIVIKHGVIIWTFLYIQIQMQEHEMTVPPKEVKSEGSINIEERVIQIK